jgi:hypothetical protein
VSRLWQGHPQQRMVRSESLQIEIIRDTCNILIMGSGATVKNVENIQTKSVRSRGLTIPYDER